MPELLHAEVTEAVIAAAVEVHRSLGPGLLESAPGLLESAYEACLCHELSLRSVAFQHRLAVPIRYKGVRLESGYRVDLLVADAVVVELKSVEHVAPIHEAQLLTYLKLTGYRVGLLTNFNTPLLKDGVTRRVV